MTTCGSGFPYSFEDADSFLGSLSADQIQSDWLTPENEDAQWGEFYGLDSNVAKNNLPQPTENGTNGNSPDFAPAIKSEHQTPEFPTPSGSFPSVDSPLATTSNSESGLVTDAEPFAHDVKKFSPGKISKPKKEKTSHNMIEKKYRTNINTKILELRDAVPSLRYSASTSGKMEELDGLAPASKINKASILTKAKEYIEHLELKNAALLAELAKLRSPVENNSFQYQQMSAPVAVSNQMNGAPSVYTMPSTQEFSSYPSPPQYQPQRNSYGSKLMVGGMTALLGSQFFDGTSGGDGFDYKGLSAVLPIHKLFPLLNNNDEVFVKLAGIVRALLVIWGMYYLLSPFFQRKSEKQLATRQSVETEEEISAFSLLSEMGKLALVKTGLIRPLGLKNAQEKMSICVKKQEQWFTSHMNTMVDPAALSLQKYTWRALFWTCLQMNTIAATPQLESLKNDTSASFYFWKIALCKLFSLQMGGIWCSLFGLDHEVRKDTLLILTWLKDGSAVEKSSLLQQIKLLFDKDINILSDGALVEKLEDVLLPKEANNPSAELKELVAKSTDEHLSIVNLVRLMKCKQVLDDCLSTHLEMLSAERSDQELTEETYQTLDCFRDLIPATCFELSTKWEAFSTLIAPDVTMMETHLKRLTDTVGHRSADGVDLEDVTNMRKSHSPERVSLLASCFALYFNKKGLRDESGTFLKYRSPHNDSELSLLNVVASLIVFQVFVSQGAGNHDKAVLERLLGNLRIAVSIDAKSLSSGGLLAVSNEVKADICDFLVNKSVQLYS